MPSVTTYTPYETLAFFQSVAKYGADASAFQDISAALIQNEFIRQNNDVERLSANALQGLYDELISAEKNKRVTKLNGDTDNGERSPKRRKLSASTSTDGEWRNGDQQLVQAVVDHLYERYKEQAVREIRKDEEAYTQLQDEIATLERASEVEEKAINNLIPTPASQTGQDQEAGSITQEHTSPSVGAFTANKLPPLESDVKQPEEGTSSSSDQNSAHLAWSVQTQAGHMLPSQVPTPSAANTPRPSVPQRKDSPSTISVGSQQSRTLPPPSPQRSNYGPVQSQAGFAMGSQGVQGQLMPHPQQRPTPVRHGSHQSQGSPVPQNQIPYPAYQQYPPPQWHPHMQAQQYQQLPGYGLPPQFYPQPVPGRLPSQSPHQAPYPQYPHSTPIQYMSAQGWRGPQYPPYPGSTVSTPISRPSSRVSGTRSDSSTPWKRKRDPATLRPPSPTRPVRDVSPVTDTESPAPDTITRKSKSDNATFQKKREQDTPTQPGRGSRRGRPPSVTPSAVAPSRSQSITSRASDTANERLTAPRRGQKVKVEPPSTPLPHPSDTEQQRSSGRRDRPRNNTITSQTEPNRLTVAKRKRDSPSPSPSMRSLTATQHAKTPSIKHDPSLIIVSKNFARTSQLLLNEIASHKLAGIFAKPLSERDAPGYKDLILRPQDLKSIKAAISKGGRAALAAIETLEAEHSADTEHDPRKPSLHESNAARPLGNGFYLVQKTDDLVPPKGIVNSARLEMELVRMFANAAMFNPLTSSERGFGRALRLRRNGGDVDHTAGTDSSSTSEQDDSEEGLSTSGGTGWDEGGIIADAREMFEDITATVGRWRDLEGERMSHGFATPSTTINGPAGEISGRQTSVGADSNVGEDDGVAAERERTGTPVPASGTARKRRKIAEH